MSFFKKNKQEYNSLAEDIRLYKIPLERAEEIIKSFKDKWIYVKFISNIYSKYNDDSSQSGIYSKFKVKDIYFDASTIRIYGFEDSDRLFLSKTNLVQTECSIELDEVKLIYKEKDIFIEIYIKMYLPNMDRRLHEIEDSKNHLIITEGKTDWKHLKNALFKLKAEGEFKQLDIDFFEYENEVQMGNDVLKRICSYQSLFENEKLKIFIFDSDDKKINNEHRGRDYICHGNNVYSLVLPIPKHREATPLISIENFYQDSEIKTEDLDQRRLYLANEFDFTTGKHSILEDVYTPLVNDKMEINHIIDNRVFKINDKIIYKEDIFSNENKENIALSKNRFATYILDGIRPFDTISVQSFGLVFDIIVSIFNDYYHQDKKHAVGEEISPGIYLEKPDNHFEVLSIHGSCSKKVALQIREATHVSYGMKLSNDKMSVILSLQFQNEEIECSIQISEKLLNFLYKKAQNKFNRIELHICDEDKNYISHKEIMNDDLCVVLIKGIFSELNN
ncbi:hypothetical protein [Paenibacillus donghaensis]|uniref:Uncharacterized protein n=1 Tax=Paenibacillus donghaensis TaxID=414771 RepID=A0A2Z2K7V8_9BACL|nr:hypothetical protein [Paenibacillus donghaensis]ASA21254.1 hypothetical protein B9T62_10935 [Paenibacillus donghaensis]